MGQWPVYFLLIFGIAFSNFDKHSGCSAKVPKNEKNLGTVLFDASTTCNHCWTREELVIISSRKVFQDLLPEIDMSNMQDDQYVANLLKFFNTCLECICKMSVGKTKHLVVKSFADTMGGYLNSYVGPITKVAFYAGNIKYCNVKRIFELIAELKDFLYTNGAGWAKPVEVEMFINVTAIVAPAKDASACDKLILDPASTAASRSKQRRRRGLKKRSSTGFNVKDSRRNRQAASFVFLPYFDNDLEPNSIALPFKDNNLWSLFDEESVAILSKYYETCLQCILSREDHKRTLADFKGDFRDWLQQVVYPRLSDEKWYPAFGGVLKIIASLRDDENRITTGKKHASKPTDDSLSTWQLILITVSTAALVWLLVGLTLACFKYRQRHSCDAPSPCESPSSNCRASPGDDVGYCALDNCPRLNRESVGHKVKEWWNKKFTFSDGCGQRREHHSAADLCKGKKSVHRPVGRRVYKKRKKSRRSASLSGSPCSSSRCAYYENKQFHYSSDMSSTNSEDSSYR